MYVYIFDCTFEMLKIRVLSARENFALVNQYEFRLQGKTLFLLANKSFVCMGQRCSY